MWKFIKKWFCKEYKHHPLFKEIIEKMEWDSLLNEEVKPFATEMEMKVTEYNGMDVWVSCPMGDKIKVEELKTEYSEMAKKRIMLERTRLDCVINLEAFDFMPSHKIEFIREYNGYRYRLEDVEEEIENINRKMNDVSGLILLIIDRYREESTKLENETIVLSQKEEAEKGHLEDAFLLDDEPTEDITSTKDTWMLNLWCWADENNIDDETIPRNKDKLIRLTVLQLFDEQLTNLPKEIGNLSNLRDLRLKRNALVELPKEIGSLKNLEYLSLGSNNLRELPKELGNLKKLRGLWIGRNKFSEVPKIVWRLRSLTGLSLADNNFMKLPKEISSLKNLRILNISRNKFEVLPAEIGNLVNLRRLDINYADSLISLPKAIGNLTNLEYLILYENNIRELPKEIGDLSNLKSLYCRFRKLIEIPKEIGKLENLISLKLILDSNTKIPKEISRLKNLKILSIPSSSLSESDFPEEIGDLTNLISLDIPRTFSNMEFSHDFRTEYHDKIDNLLRMIKEKNKTTARKNNCYLETRRSYLQLSPKTIYTPKGTFPYMPNELKIISQNFRKEIEAIEKKLADGNVEIDTFRRFKIRAAVDKDTIITVGIEADGWHGFINKAYNEYCQERPPTTYKYIHEVPYFDELIASSDPFWNDLAFAEVVLLHFKKIMKELTKDAFLSVSAESEMGSWDITEIEDFQKNPHITKLEKIVPIKKRKVEEPTGSTSSSTEDLRQNENVPRKQKIHLEVKLTPDIYLDENGLAARRRLFASQAVQSLAVQHDSGNRYDSKAIKVFYDHTDIGFIMKKGSNGKVDDFCFEGNSLLEDVELIFKDGKLVLIKNVANKEKEQY